MQLKRSIAGKGIASVPPDAQRAGNFDYLNAKRRLLMASHTRVIAIEKQPPVCYIHAGSK